MEPHANLALIEALLGTWRGAGHGEYPTITSFDYADEWTFSHTGKPFLAFVQRTRSPAGAPMHTEAGYLRATPAIEIVAALPTGQTELGTGTAELSDGVLTVTTDAEVRCTPSAKSVDRIVRRFRLEGDVLDYDMQMAAVGVGLTLHLTSRLTRQPASGVSG